MSFPKLACDPPRQVVNGNGTVAEGVNSLATYGERRLRLNPNMEHKPEKYDDVESDYGPIIFSMLERHLPPNMLDVSRDAKISFMKDILSKYLPEGERSRAQRNKEYRHKIISAYEPLHKELFTMHPSTFFVPEFIKAISDNNEESLRNIISEPSPGLYTFSMLQPLFCDMMVSEVENFEKWIGAVKLKIMRPNTMNKYGVVLDDFGLESMLDVFMEDFISPLSRVLFLEVGGQSLDSHHGFVVEYGKDKDRELGFHVDDSEVTLNVCLGTHFSGGELFFRGVRCEKHVNTEIQPEEVFDYQHVPGQAILHRGRHRHGALPTTSGYRINLILWCRSSNFREMKKYQKDFSCWCGECLREKKERQSQTVDATRLAFLRREGGSQQP